MSNFDRLLERSRLEGEQARLLVQLLDENPDAVLERPDKSPRRSDADSLRGIGVTGKWSNVHRSVAGVRPADTTRSDRNYRKRSSGLGVTTRLTLTQILRKSAGRCYLCRIPLSPRTMQVEHIIPLAHGGTHSDENVAAACDICNLRKSARIVSFMVATRKPVYTPIEQLR